MIGASAFSGCEKLKTINIPAKVKVLRTGTFSECAKLEKVILNEGLTTIQQEAFYHCENLKTLTIPSTVTKVTGRIFETNYECMPLETLICKSKDVLKEIKYFGYELKTVDLSQAKTLKKIPDEAFSGVCYQKIILPKGLKTIGKKAFYESFIKQVIFSTTVTEIQESAFENCVNLKKVNLPSSVTVIGKAAFKGCKFSSDDFSSFPGRMLSLSLRCCYQT